MVFRILIVNHHYFDLKKKLASCCLMSFSALEGLTSISARDQALCGRTLFVTYPAQYQMLYYANFLSIKFTTIRANNVKDMRQIHRASSTRVYDLIIVIKWTMFYFLQSKKSNQFVCSPQRKDFYFTIVRFALSGGRYI